MDRILVVEDERAMREIIRDYLIAHGLECDLSSLNLGSNMGLLHWGLKVLAIGPLGKSQSYCIEYWKLTKRGDFSAHSHPKMEPL